MMKKISFLIFSLAIVFNIYAIDLNNASLDELLNGTNIDLIDAMKILDYRKDKKIKDIDQLVNENIISSQVGKRFKDSIKKNTRVEPVQDLRIREVFSGPRTDVRSRANNEQLFSENETFQKILEKMSAKDYPVAAKYISYFRKNFRESIYTDDIIYFAAAIYEENNQTEKAISNYSIIYERFPNSDISVIALFRIAICYEKSDIMSKAEEYYRRIVLEYSNTLWAGKARQRLEEI
ncbi:MAG: tetratricopeptide repeat protein [Candidatus Muirbacterium halophilum]|nr:tetratricopeptide repeat protein [Candidatus Muirbacterium halophilum]MCK9475276.1 tetratricopeptide repeat protein [Candidatus Muirbacterium halophilum]